MAPINEDELQREAQREAGRRARDELIHISFSFVTDTWLGRLKVAELVISLLCGACNSSILWSYCPGHYGFLGFVAWTAFINVLIDLILRILGLWDRLYYIFRHPALMLVLCALACVGFLIGGSLAASCAYKSHKSSTASASAVFAFICLALFAIDAFIHFREYRSMENEARRQSNEDKADPNAVI